VLTWRFEEPICCATGRCPGACKRRYYTAVPKATSCMQHRSNKLKGTRATLSSLGLSHSIVHVYLEYCKSGDKRACIISTSALLRHKGCLPRQFEAACGVMWCRYERTIC
jgi:hypothetical protein